MTRPPFARQLALGHQVCDQPGSAVSCRSGSACYEQIPQPPMASFSDHTARIEWYSLPYPRYPGQLQRLPSNWIGQD